MQAWKLILTQVSSDLASRGWRSFGHEVLTSEPAANGCYGWIGLNGTPAGVGATVGLVHPGLSRTCANALNRAYGAGTGAWMIRKPGIPVLQYVAGPDENWGMDLLDSGRVADYDIRRYARMIEAAFHKRIDLAWSLGEIVEAFRRGGIIGGQASLYLIPVALMMIGDKPALQSLLQDFRSRNDFLLGPEYEVFLEAASEIAGGDGHLMMPKGRRGV